MTRARRAISTSFLLRRHVQQSSMQLLSTIWVVLCASLVAQRVHLVEVFFAFAASFALALLLSNFITGKSRSVYCRVKTYVGRFSCVASLLMVGITRKFSVRSYIHPMTRLFVFICERRQECSLFEAISIVTGYLAFDLWFTHMNIRPLPQNWRIGEDAITLAMFLTLLSKLDEKELDKYWLQFFVWCVAKFVRLPLRPLSLREDEPRHQLTGKNSLSYDRCRTLAECENDACCSKSREKKRLSKNCVSEDCSDVEKKVEVQSSRNLWTIHGKCYDLSGFVDRHPGGRNAIELGRGRDCTGLFESYHPFTDAHRAVLKKHRSYEVYNAYCGVQAEGSKPAGLSNVKNEYYVASGHIGIHHCDDCLDPFYETLKRRAAKILFERGVHPIRDRTATFSRLVYYGALCLCVVYCARLHIKAKPLGSFFFAIFAWLLGCLGHDGGHFAVSRKPWINSLAVWGMSLLCNPVMWQHQHTFAHHSCTNEFDRDPDLRHFDYLLRVHRRIQNNKGRYRFQRNPLYIAFIYMFVVFGSCVWVPVGFIKDGTIYGIVEWTDQVDPFRAIAAFFHLILYSAVIMAAPFLAATNPAKAMLSVIIHISLSGLLFGIFSQINHLNHRSFSKSKVASCDPSITLVRSGRKTPSNRSWAISQVQASNDFAPGSTLWHYFSNGLNLQIEHHLFPGVNHCHLHLLAPMVRETCIEFEVEYKSYNSWLDIMQATMSWMNDLSYDD